MSKGHWKQVLVHCNGQIGEQEADGTCTAAELRPRPEVIKELDSGHCPPRHGAYQSDVEGQQVHHHAVYGRLELVEDEGADEEERTPSIQIEGLPAKRSGILNLGDGKHQQANLKVHWRLFPDEEDVAEAGEDEADEDPARVAIVLGEVHAVEQHE